MQDWDRMVMMGIGTLVSLFTVWDSRKLWKKRRYAALLGVGILVVGAVGVPLLLAIFAT